VPAGAGASYCASCGLLLGAPRHRPVLVENRWVPGPDELAVFFGVRALSGIFVKTLRLPATARASILQGGQATELPQGEYEIEGFFTRLTNLLREAGPGDRILLPRAWQDRLPDGFAEGLRAQGASVACVERIGII
jgi:hypothetical protein